MATSDAKDDERLLRSPTLPAVLLLREFKFAVEVNEEAEAPDEGTVEILRSLPRPLIPLFEFLYRDAKYSQRSLSCAVTGSPSRMVLNFDVRYRKVPAWNLFWCD
jgi:hypothetical protein